MTDAATRPTQVCAATGSPRLPILVDHLGVGAEPPTPPLAELLPPVLDALTQAVAVLDERFAIVWVNHALAKLVGRPAAELIGSSWGSLIGCAALRVDPQPCSKTSACPGCDTHRMMIAAGGASAAKSERATLTVVVADRIEEVEVGLSVAPVAVAGRRFLVMTLDELQPLRQAYAQRHSAAGLHGMIGRSSPMQEIFHLVREVAPTDMPVLILGESGTGKERVAHAIHRESRRAGKLFVPVNCGAIPEGLIESELFGHVKGAFTGAVRDRKGRFELADGGTLFLDEVGELSPAMQVRLLRVLETGVFERVGDERSMQVNARIVCATNRDLVGDVKAGRFRADLFYRLNVVPLQLPPLRTRLDDIPLLTEHFLARICTETERQPAALSPAVLEALTRYAWPGNIRELDNVLRFALVKAQGGPLTLEHLPAAVRNVSRQPVAPPRATDRLAPDLVAAAISATGGNMTSAARQLGVGRATLYRFLDRTKSQP